MPDPKLDIKISTSGAAQSAREIESVGNAAGKAGQQASKAGAAAGQGFNQFSKAGNDAAAVINNLETASKGGIAGIFGIANAMRALIGIVRGAVAATGPLGILVTLLGTGLAAAMAVFSRESKSAEGSVDSLQKKAQELGKVQLEQLKGQLSAIAEGANDAVSEFDRLAKAAGEVDRAETGARIARLRARTDISEADRLKLISAEEQGLSDRSRSSGIRSLENARDRTGEALVQAQKTAAGNAENLATAEARLQDLTRRREAASELRGLKLASVGIEDPDVAANMAARMRELKDIVGEGPAVTDADIAGAKEEVEQLKNVVSSASGTLQQLVNAFVQATRNLETGVATAQQVGTAEKQERAANLEVSLRSAPKPQFAPVDESRLEALKGELGQIDSQIGTTSSFGNPRYDALQASRASIQAEYDQEESRIAGIRAANDRVRYEQQRGKRGAAPTAGPARLETYSGSGSGAGVGSDGILRSTEGHAKALSDGIGKMTVGLDGYLRTATGHTQAIQAKLKRETAERQKMITRLNDSRP